MSLFFSRGFSRHFLRKLFALGIPLNFCSKNHSEFLTQTTDVPPRIPIEDLPSISSEIHCTTSEVSPRDHLKNHSLKKPETRLKISL